MPNWLLVIIIVAIIGGVIGYFTSSDGNRGEGAAQGAIGSAIGCGYVLFQLFLWVAGIALAVWLFGAIF